MIELKQTGDGVIVPVRAQAGARTNGIVGVHDRRLKVAVTQAPEKGKANEALRRTIAEGLGLKPAQVTLVAGATSTHKQFLLTGIALDEVRMKIHAMLDDANSG
jgi:uncharacterized protein (TIGR00251 family)